MKGLAQDFSLSVANCLWAFMVCCFGENPPSSLWGGTQEAALHLSPEMCLLSPTPGRRVQADPVKGARECGWEPGGHALLLLILGVDLRWFGEADMLSSASCQGTALSK